MRKLLITLRAVCLVALSGCGCLETWEDRSLTRYDDGGPEPKPFLVSPVNHAARTRLRNRLSRRVGAGCQVQSRI